MAAKKEAEVQFWQTVSPVEISPNIETKSEAQTLLITTRQGAGFEVGAGLLAHAIQSRATHVLMDFSQQACALRYQVDGVWEQVPPLDRETGDAMLYALKQLCLLNPADRRSSQTGSCGLKAAKTKYTLTIQAKGTPTGERVLARLEPIEIPFEKMGDLGMRDKMLGDFKQWIDSSGNFMLISAPKGEGLTTTWTVAMNTVDRFVRDLQSFEEEGKPEPEIININPNIFGGDTGLTQVEMVAKAILKEPDVFLFPELPEPEVLQLALEKAASIDKQVITRIVAPNAVSAVAQLVSKYPASASAIANLIGAVVNQRLVRRLCDNCKIGYQPPPQLLKKLGIPQGRVAVLYNPFIPPPIEQQVDENGKPAPITPCHICEGRGYFGRTAIFELLLPGPKFKDALLKSPDVNKLTQIAKAEGHRGTQSEAVLAVARGLTSLDELKKLFAKK
jgi:type II secretory ATPase GspE/PulE/Tfp pilus assembly ATPase PilB-like protein